MMLIFSLLKRFRWYRYLHGGKWICTEKGWYLISPKGFYTTWDKTLKQDVEFAWNEKEILILELYKHGR